MNETTITQTLTKQCAAKCAERMAVMRYFPTVPGAAALIAEELMRFCVDDDKARAMTDEALRTREEWPSIAGLRDIYANHWPPLDEVKRA